MNTRIIKTTGPRAPKGGSEGTIHKLFTTLLVFSLALLGCVGSVSIYGTDSVSATSISSAEPESLNATVPLIISEYRLRGAGGSKDEFVEIYNNSNSAWTVASINGTGYGLAASDGVLRFTIPNGTVIPARGHYLGVNSVGYSLSAQAAGDSTYLMDIPDNAGIALFNNNSGGGSFNPQNRIDAVGPTSEMNTLYRKGNGVPPITPFSIDYSFIRNQNLGCSALLKDTGENGADFVFVDTNATQAGADQRLGAPGPQNMASALAVQTGIGGTTTSLVDIGLDRAAGPNATRSFTSDPAHNSTFGTLDLRHKFTNNTGVPLTRLRFRVVDLSAYPSPSGTADLRILTSSDLSVSLSAAAGGGSTMIRGTTLEVPPTQPNGGAINSTISVPSVTLGTQLAPGASINLRFVLGIQQTGKYRIALTPETLPVSDKNINLVFEGSTDTFTVGEPCSNNTHHADFDGDGKADISLFRPNGGTWYSLNSSNGAFNQVQFGLAADQIVPGDYDGDGITDLAVFRPSIGTWYVQRSATGFTSFQFGLVNDMPAQADFDGDGKTDFAVFRPSTGAWYVQASTAGFLSQFFGSNADKPVVGDYDGDNKADVAVYRPSTGTWYINRSLLGFTAAQFGLSTDRVVPADYDGDGKIDIAVFRPSDGTWYQMLSGSGFAATAFGTSGDIPAPGDFDFDGKADLAVFRSSTGAWYRQQSSAGFSGVQFGQSGDQPVTAGYVPFQ